jgi:hypothetical protein
MDAERLPSEGPDEVLERARREIASAPDARSLDEIRARYLGRKGLITRMLRAIGELPA